ncbi:MAG: hypothetical protein RIQ91_635 [Bacteroidota bacterium]
MAVVGPATVYRACLDRPTFTLTVSVSPPTDACGSFGRHRLYGREDAFSPWKLLKETSVLNTTLFTATLPNTKAWEVFVSTGFSCSGADTFNSNHVLVDNQAPAQFEPDSVSVEFNSQRVVAGWKKPLDLDVLGYSLFKLAGGGNALIKDTIGTFYRFDTTTFNPRTSNNSFSIAAFDSCLNGGLLSNYHSPVYLTVQVNSKFWCAKKTTLTWTKYRGWVAAKYGVWRLCITDGRWEFLGDVLADLVNDPSVYTFLDTTYEVNKRYLYFVRAHKPMGNISSSSNTQTIDYGFLGNAKPISNITGVSVLGDNQIRLDVAWKKDGPSSTLSIEKKMTTGWASIYSTGAAGNLLFNDNTAQTQLSFAEYRLIRTNDCGAKDDTSYVHNSILLTENQRVMSWNSHVGWTNNALNTAFRYHLEQYNGSTWNAIYSGTGSSYNLPNNLYGNQRFRVKIYSDDGKLPINYELYSNERKVYLGFDSSAFDTTLIPSAFNPSGINQIFKISNPAIAPGESEMTIYNRWGELLFKGDALLGWNGTDPSGNEVPQGAYIYLIQTSYRNKRTRYSGTLVLIK